MKTLWTSSFCGKSCCLQKGQKHHNGIKLTHTNMIYFGGAYSALRIVKLMQNSRSYESALYYSDLGALKALSFKDL